jgi:hypothetical protein
MTVIDGLRDSLPPAYERFRLNRYHVAPDDLRPGSLGKPTPAHFIVAPRYRRKSRTTLDPMTPAETLVHLVRCTFNLGTLGSAGFRTLCHIAENARGYRLAIGDVEGAVAAVRGLLGR